MSLGKDLELKALAEDESYPSVFRTLQTKPFSRGQPVQRFARAGLPEDRRVLSLRSGSIMLTPLYWLYQCFRTSAAGLNWGVKFCLGNHSESGFLAEGNHFQI